MPTESQFAAAGHPVISSKVLALTGAQVIKPTTLAKVGLPTYTGVTANPLADLPNWQTGGRETSPAATEAENKANGMFMGLSPMMLGAGALVLVLLFVAKKK